MIRKTFVAVLVVILSGCITVGKEVHKAQVDTFQKGKTTTQQVIDALGPPTTITTNSDGKQIYSYNYYKASAKPATFIPFVGLFAGGADVRQTGAVFHFSPDGILETYAHSVTETSGGRGYVAPNPSPSP